MNFYRSLGFYKPSAKGNGSAFQFRRVQRKDKNREPVAMISACNQMGPKPKPGSTDSPFPWKESQVVFMLNAIECAELSAYIVNMQKSEKIVSNGIRLIHDIERDDGNNIAKFFLKKPDSGNKYGNWGIGLERGEEKVMMFLSPGEVYMIKSLCDQVINAYIGDTVENFKSTKNEPKRSHSF